jgi:hypothetical protein
MKKRITHIAPWQAAKVSAVLYFVVGLIVAVPVGLMSLFVPPQPGHEPPGIGFVLSLPILYALIGLIFVPLGCWLYNTVAKFVGGFEITTSD